MKVISGRILGSKYKLHRIKNGEGRYTSGSIVLIGYDGKKTILKRGEYVGVQDMIMMIDLSPWGLWKLFCYALFGVKEHKVQ